jgi:hypothetical protein
MKCITSPALDDIQILSFAEGEADDAVVAHIKECTYCSEKVRQWTQLQNRLRRHFYRGSCPTPMELGDYHLGYLSASQALVVSQHLRECPLCRREIATLEDFLASLTPESGLLGKAKVLIGRLVGAQSENGLGPVAPVLRGEARGPLTFEADGIVIVLDIQPTMAGKVNIFGQVAAEDQEQWTEAVVELRHSNKLQASTSVDDLGAFRIENIEPGSKELWMILKDGSLILVSNFML